jgi:hypothetical protein
MMQETNHHRFQTRLAAVTSIIHAAHQAADNGMALEISALEEAIASLQQEALRLPDTERDMARKPLLELVENLDRLTTTLQEHANILKGNLQGVTASADAARAYLKAPKT